MKFFAQLLLTYIVLPLTVQAQLSGKITDANGEPLPFANVYIEGTSRGTSANTEGVYFLDLKNGTYRLVFQYIGYNKKIETAKINGATVLDIQLQTSEIELSEFVVKSNAEDPAYPIIRKAMEMRPVFRDQVPAYACDVYIKGVQKIIDAPKKFMGRDIGDMGGTLDTVSRSGIVYLSETISKLYVDGGKKKEELMSSKVSGNDNGFGFNRATLFDFSFYDNHIEIARQILSPISDNAFTYYKFRLISTIKDQQGNNVYKIEVIPKRKEDPTWAGFIYIVDNQWNISATDLYVTGKSIQQTVLDTLVLKQSFVQVDKAWRLFSQGILFKISIFGIHIKGDFTGVYSNYNLTPQYEKRFFNNEVFKASKGKDDNDLNKWDTLRPIPLTLEERKDYFKKDSLQKIRQTKPYLDSVARQQNKFRIINLLIGYTYSDYWNRRSFTVASPLSTFSFNPVQGGNIALNMTYNKNYGERFQPYSKSLSVTPSVSYGFAEKKFRAHIASSYLFNRFNHARLTIEGGQNVAQFNEQNPISISVAEWYALYGKKHFYKIFDKSYAKLSYSQEIVTGVTGKVSIETAHRTPLSINSQYSFKKKDDTYPSNVPFNIYQAYVLSWNGLKNAHTVTFDLAWTPAQRYLTYPQYKDIEGSDYPTFSVRYKKAIKLTDNSVDFDQIRFKIEKQNIKMGIAGYSEINTAYGRFLSKKSAHLIDYQHFNGNETFLSHSLNYMEGFFNLPYYQFSTTKPYVMAHWQHHFEGFIFNKIPLIRKLGFKEVVRAAYVTMPDLKNYTELGFGIDNIGWGLFRFIRVDMSWRMMNNRFDAQPQFMIGFKM